MPKISHIRELIEAGLSDADIEDLLIEAQADQEDEIARFGRDDHDEQETSRDREIGDRLDMGRNEAGEWRGFM